jgi:hypothetical protein
MIEAGLIKLGRVDALHPDPFAVEHEGVSIQYPCDAGQRRLRMRASAACEDNRK